MKSTSSAQHGTVYDPPTGDTGTAKTEGAWGHIVLSYTLDPTTQVLSYTIVDKSWDVPESSVWGGIQDSINGCSTA